MNTPQEVVDVINKLESDDQAILTSYIDELKSKISNDGTEGEPDIFVPIVPAADESETLPPMYESGDDMDKATTYKMEAADLKSSGDYQGALEKYNLAITSAPPSAMLLANRGDILVRLGQDEAAVRDCDAALEKNPDSAKALRTRGKAYKSLEEYAKARKDLSASQMIDYDDGAAEALKFVTKKMQEIEGEEVKKKVAEEDRLRKKAEDIKKAQEEARREAEEEAARETGMPDMGGMGGMPGMGGMGGMPGMGGMGGMPDMGGMGGMPGMGGMGGMPGMGGMGGMGGLMSALLSDPELAAGMQNPKVMAALSNPSELMGNPAKLQELMADPEVGPIFQKLMTKLGPMMGGMGGMPGMGGMGGAAGGSGDDDIPDMDDLPDLE
jgi:suppressor of tumorigenicity protein 13